jgi:hypothetical protein
VISCGVDAQITQHPDRDQVPRIDHGFAHSGGPKKCLAKVFRLPGSLQLRIFEHDRCVIDQAGGGKAIGQGGGIQKRFEGRPRLSPALCDAIELAATEFIAADQRTQSAIFRVD